MTSNIHNIPGKAIRSHAGLVRTVEHMAMCVSCGRQTRAAYHVLPDVDLKYDLRDRMILPPGWRMCVVSEKFKLFCSDCKMSN